VKGGGPAARATGTLDPPSAAAPAPSPARPSRTRRILGLRAGTRRDDAVVALFALTMLLSAALLFAVQPMVARFVLPVLGGSPAVWTVSVLFFQAALLLGYLYVHLGVRRLGVRRMALVHGVLLLLPALVLPLAVPDGRGPGEGSPSLWLLALLATTVGLPFFVLAATAPLLQRWLAGTNHPEAADPYVLYRASNLGSLVGLLAYPLVLEPQLGLETQGVAWSVGYGVLAVLLLACAAVVVRLARPGSDRAATARRARATRPAPDGRRLLTWVGLAAVPSSLMLSVTELVTTDLSPVPLLWTLPLALYLLSFIATFGPGGRTVYRLASLALPVAVVGAAALWAFDVRTPLALVVVAHLVAFAVVALVAHGRLADERPAAEHLTAFYLALAAGGALGGLFNSLVAPAVFTTLTEYPVALVLAGLCLAPGAFPLVLVHRQERDAFAKPWLDWAVPAGLLAVLLAVLWALGPEGSRTLDDGRLLLHALVAVFLVVLAFRPRRFALGVAAALVAIALPASTVGEETVQERSFFGRVEVQRFAAGLVRTMTHGTTLHGSQVLLPEQATVPTSYYHPTGPVGEIVRLARRAGLTDRVAIGGLGTGSMACHARDGERWTFFEIDPVVVRLARDTGDFTYLRDCAGRHDVVVGDARIAMRERPPASFGLVVLDAFSSDAVPSHLLTREAVAEYVQRLRPGGLIGAHISNRHLRLEPVLGAVARSLGLTCLTRRDGTTDRRGQRVRFKVRSHWVALARRPADLAGLDTESGRWRACATGDAVWTDDHTDVLSAIDL